MTEIIDNKKERRNRPRITKMEALWLEARANGKTPLEAARIAGYADPYSAAFKLSRNQTLIATNQIVLAAAGIDLPLFAKVLKDAFVATRLIKATYKGEITDEREVPDHDIRLRALQIAVDLAGIKPAEEHKLVVAPDENDTSQFYLVPDGYHNMNEAEAIEAAQRRMQEFAMGTPLEQKRIAPLAVDDADDDDDYAFPDDEDDNDE